MTYKGHVENGVIVLDESAALPEGTRVEVALEIEESSDHAPLTLLDSLRPFAGSIDGLPPDLAENHDHYIHGTRKRS